MKDPRAVGRLVVFALLMAGCYRSAMDAIAPDEPAGGTGGIIAKGGTVGAGAGGAGGYGGVISDGGIVGYGGVISDGGVVGYGGVVSDGGTVGYGGVVSYGGVVGHGGIVGYGGVVGYGGYGGVDTSNGGQTSLNSGNTVTYNQGFAQGAMTGAGWVALGALDTITSPTCLGMPITNSIPCAASTTWSSSNALCASGLIPALPASPVQSDYDNNWGIDICANATTPPGGGLAASFKTITVYLSGTPTTGLRVELHRGGDADDVWYCANFISGSAVVLAALNTKCWDGSGLSLSAADVINIDRVGIQVPSTSVPVTLNNLCITKIVFGN